MRVLITWGSTLGGTEGIARTVSEVLRNRGIEVDLVPPENAGKATGFDAVIVGGALYANRWHADARRFVHQREDDLRRVPIWFFSTGPLDTSADSGTIAPTRHVRALMESVGALGHMTFGGRIPADARGFPAGAMARTHAGDWRNTAQIEAWAEDIARALPTAKHGLAVPQPGRALGRLAAHAVVGWALLSVITALLHRMTTPSAALILHAAAAPVLFLVIAQHYFHPADARDPRPTAAAFVAIVGLLDGIMSAAFAPGWVSFTSVTATWLPLGLIGLTTWTTGAIMSTLPWPKPPRGNEQGGRAAPPTGLRPQPGG